MSLNAAFASRSWLMSWIVWGGFNSDLISKIVGMCETASEPHFLQWICTIFSQFDICTKCSCLCDADAHGSPSLCEVLVTLMKESNHQCQCMLNATHWTLATTTKSSESTLSWGFLTAVDEQISKAFRKVGNQCSSDNGGVNVSVSVSVSGSGSDSRSGSGVASGGGSGGGSGSRCGQGCNNSKDTCDQCGQKRHWANDPKCKGKGFSACPINKTTSSSTPHAAPDQWGCLEPTVPLKFTKTEEVITWDNKVFHWHDKCRKRKRACVSHHKSATHHIWWEKFKKWLWEQQNGGIGSSSKTVRFAKGSLAAAQQADSDFIADDKWMRCGVLCHSNHCQLLCSWFLFVVVPWFLSDCLLLLIERDKLQTIFRISMDMLVRNTFWSWHISSVHQKHHTHHKLFDWQSINWLAKDSLLLTFLLEKHRSFDHTCSLRPEAAATMGMKHVGIPFL